MKSKIPMVVRILMGLLMVVFGANKFFNFMPMPEIEVGASNFLDAIINTGYLWKVIGLVEIISGLMLIIGIYVPLALLLFAPIIVNVILFHIFLNPSGIGPGALLFIFEVYLLFAYKPKFESVLSAS